MGYKIPEIIADIYSPILLIVIAAIIRNSPTKRRRLVSAMVAYMAGAFGFMLLDKIASLWPRFGLDYSTHTAFAVVCVWWICKNLKPIFWRIFWSASPLVYFALMVHLDYHTAADILTTMSAMGLWIAFYEILSAAIRKFKNGNLNSSQTRAYEHDPHRDHQ